MTAERWEQVAAAFHLVVDVEEPRRKTRVKEVCRGDEALEREVLELLRKDASSLVLDEELPSSLWQEALSPSAHPDPAMRSVGPYRILKLLGEGGMGVVYLGERTDIGGKVAIKFLRDAWLSPRRRQRFTLEQQTLVHLNHPAIARIYDAGATEQGTPWFVMEYIDGLPITEHISAHSLSLNRALHLFTDVCQAVKYAHLRAIVHRDLKPSNIFVTHEGAVKLLDFGVAKQLSSGEDGCALTLQGDRVLTPAYAAPECKSGGIIGTFTDIYSLGVIFYELLAGALPRFDSSASGSPRALAPSQANSAESRKKLSKREWADLDTICLRCLEPEPERRYASVDELEADVHAFLSGLPLASRAETFVSLLARLVRRYRTPVVASVSAALLLLTAGVLFTVQLSKANAAARVELERSRRLAEFTESLFTGGGAVSGPKYGMALTTLLTRGEEQARHSSDDPRLQSDMYAVLGDIYLKVGAYTEAERLLKMSLAEQDQLPGPKTAAYGNKLLSLAELYGQENEYKQAEQISSQILALRSSLAKGEVFPVDRELALRGAIANSKGEFTQGAELYSQAIASSEGSSVPVSRLIEYTTGLGEAYAGENRLELAEPILKRSLELSRKHLGDRRPEEITALDVLGMSRWDKNTVPRLQRAAEIAEQWYSPDDLTTASCLADLAQGFAFEKRIAEERIALAGAMAIISRHSSGLDVRELSAWYISGSLALSDHQFAKSEEHLQKALAIANRFHSGTFVMGSDMKLAEVELKQHHEAKAESYARAALASSRAHTLPLLQADASVVLGSILLREDKLSEAQKATESGWAYLKEHPIDAGIHFEMARHTLAQVLMRTGHANEAKAFLRPRVSWLSQSSKQIARYSQP